uniref:RNA1 polyprotein n=1 Tax=Squash mosaic virus TaxID=12263 RepID=A0A1Z2TIK8_9SECO|nr:polyprotein [Squash mosaic virus]
MNFTGNGSVASVHQVVHSEDVMFYLKAYTNMTTDNTGAALPRIVATLKEEQNKHVLYLSFYAYCLDFDAGLMEPHSVDVEDFVFEQFHDFVTAMLKGCHSLMPLRSYTKTIFTERLQLAVNFIPEITTELGGSGPVEAQMQGLRNIAANMLMWVPKKIGALAAWTVDSIIGSFKEHFLKMINTHCPIVLSTFPWILKIWDRVTEWLTMAADDFAWLLASTKELMTWGMAIMALTTAMSLLDKLLIAVGAIAEPMNLSDICLRTGVVAACCYELTKQSGNCGAQLVSLFSGVANVVAGVLSAKFQNQPQTILQDSPIGLLETLAERLTSLCDVSLINLGKTCAAINQIATCANTIKGFVAKIFCTLTHYVWEALGIKTSFLRDATFVLGEDVDGWLQQISQCQNDFIVHASCSQDEFLKLQILAEKGNNMRNKILQGVRLSPGIISLVTSGIAMLDKLRREACLQGNRTERKMPFTIFCQGTSRVGKTLLTSKIVKDFQAALGLSEDTVYSRNPAESYWSGYRRQPFVLIDDFGAVKTEPSCEAQLIPLVSSTPYPVPMAAIEEKGMMFDSQFIVCSTNFLEPSPEAKIRDDAAFRNRRHVLISVKVDNEKQYDSSDFTQNQIYEIMHYERETYVVVQRFTSYADLFVFLQNKYEAHNAEQSANIGSVVPYKGKQNLLILRGLLNLANVSNAGLLKAQAKKLGQPEGFREYTHLFTIQHKNRFAHLGFADAHDSVIWYGEHSDVGRSEEMAKMTASHVMKAYKILIQGENLSLLIKNHLRYLVCPDNYDRDFNFTGGVGDTLLEQQLLPDMQALHTWERFVLCAMGYYMETQKMQPWYKTVTGKVFENLKAAYSREFSSWPTPLKAIVGIVLAALVGKGFWFAYKALTESGNGSSLVGAASVVLTSTTNAVAQSRKPNRFDVAQYRYRNVPLKRRQWADAQMSLDHSSVAIMSKCKANFEFGNTNVQIVLVPGRRFLGYAHFFKTIKHPITVKIVKDGRHFLHVYDPKGMTYFDDSEICVYHSASFEDIPHTTWDVFCWDWEKSLCKKFPADFLSCKYDRLTMSYEPTYAGINVETVFETLELRANGAVRKLPCFLKYEAPTVDRDCGSLIVAQVEGRYQIVGIHIGGDGRNGFAAPLPHIPQVADAQCTTKYFSFYPNEQEEETGVALVGQLKPDVWIPLPTKTSLVETEEEWHLGTKSDKVPSILSSEDPRIKQGGNEGYDPFRGGVTKYSQPMGHLCGETLGEVANEILEEWHDCLEPDEDFDDVDLDVAINGIDGLDYMDRIPLATSEGFPHILSRERGEKGKGRFVETVGGKCTLIEGTSVYHAFEILQEQCKKEVPTLIGIECPKDEKLPLRKVYDTPKTRCFTILPMEYNLLVRMKFLKFVRFIMRNREKLACQVGINPYSMEWTRLAGSLLSIGQNILCCDYKSFDGLLSKQVMTVIATMINRLCGGSQESQTMRMNLLMACCSRYAISKSEVWRVECGIPSGFPLTVICNSIFNEILVRYCYRKILEKNNVPRPLHVNFPRMVKLVTYGDDNLISVSHVVSGVFNGRTLKAEMAQFGVTITDGIDKTSPTLEFRKLSNCDFLKRGFKLNGLVYDSPEEKSSLWAQLHYVNTTNLDKQEAYLVNLNNVLKELYMHSPEEMNTLRRKALQLPWINKDDVLNGAQIKEFFAYQRQHLLPDNEDSLDMMLKPDLLGSLVPDVVLLDKGVQVSGRLKTINLKYTELSEKRDNEFWVIFNGHFPTNRLPEHCLNIKWEAGTGRGNLPTQSWISNNISRSNSEYNRKIRTAYAAGKVLCFCAWGDMIPVSIMLLLSSARNNWIPKGQTNEALTSFMEYAKSLKFLPRECEYAFTDVK